MIKDILNSNESMKPNTREIEVLREHFPACFKSDGSFDLERFKEYLNDKVTVKNEGYELKFLGKNYARLLASVDSTTVIVPDEEHNNKPENKNSENIYISGDNLDGLKHLLKSYAGHVKCIYIDPPYNTGNKDFVYDDLKIGDDDGYRHSKWISFMKSRLVVAKRVLKEHGIILISIDDNEVAQLKMLSSEIFGENNYVGTIVWKKKTNGNNMGWLPPVHDYILCYAKNIEQIYDIGLEVGEEEIAKRYSNPDDDPRGPWTTSDLSANHVGPSFAIHNPKTGQIFYPPEGRYWVFNEKEVIKRIEDGRIIFGKSGTARPVQKVFAKERIIGKRKVESWWDDCALNSDATKELKSIFGIAKVFTHPKPSKLIKRLLEMSCDKNAIVLDFFAGSGTTAQAVLELNQEDGGDRHFILCTNNDSDICSNVTYPRIKTVITGKRIDGTEYSEGIPANLKYYRTDFVAKDSEDLYEDLLNHIIEMIQLEYGVKVDNKKYVIIMDDDEMDAFEEDFEQYSDLKAIFLNQDVLLSTSQEQLLAEINTFIIPDCYFDFELREAGELW